MCSIITGHHSNNQFLPLAVTTLSELPALSQHCILHHCHSMPVFSIAVIALPIGSLRWDHVWARERQAEVKTYKYRTTKRCQRRCYSFIFLFRNFNCLVNCLRDLILQEYFYYTTQFISRLPFVRKFKQNVNLVNQLSNSSLYVVVLFPPKTSAPWARVHNNRNWHAKRTTRSSLITAMSAVMEQALVLP